MADVFGVSVTPYVSLADASGRDHSTMDKQFPGLHNDLLFLWAMVDTAVSRDIAWMHGTMQQDGGPTPANSWSTMDIIKIRATPRD